MHQSHTFNARLQQLKESNLTHYTLPQETTFHKGSQPTKKLVILWEKTGRRKSLKYSNLDDVDLETEGELHTLTLYLYYCTVVLKGYRLDLLFDRFMVDEPFVIVISEQRYAELNEPGQFFLAEAEVV